MTDSLRVTAILEVLVDFVQGNFDSRLPVVNSDDPWDAVHAAINIAGDEFGRRTARLEASESRFRSVFQQSEVPMVLASDGRILRVNAAFVSVIGYDDASELVGRSVDDVTHPDDRAANARIGRSGSTRKRYLRRDGSVFWAYVVVNSFDDPVTGRNVSVAVIRDVTAEHNLEEQRRSFVARVVAAQEEERQRVSRELHDALGQSLTNLALRLRVLEERSEDEHTRVELARLRTMTESATHETSRLAHRLRPLALEELGLEAALRALVADNRRPGLRVALHLSGLEQRLPAAMETALYRIAQEALTNVQKHANAKRAIVLLAVERGVVRLMVEDDGCGIDEAVSTRKGLGLDGIRERAALLGGTMEVESSPGRGTTIQVRATVEGR